MHEFDWVKRDNLIERVPEKSKVLVDGLNKLKDKYPNIIDSVHGVGLYQGFSVCHRGTLDAQKNQRNQIISTLLHKYGTLVLGAGSYSIRVRPPLTVSVLDIAHFINNLDAALREIQEIPI